jgi:hypothetical protein
MPNTLIQNVMNVLSLTEQQVNLIIISLVSVVIQMSIYVLVLKKGSFSLVNLLYFFIVMLYNIMYYKVFMS